MQVQCKCRKFALTSRLQGFSDHFRWRSFKKLKQRFCCVLFQPGLIFWLARFLRHRRGCFSELSLAEVFLLHAAASFYVQLNSQRAVQGPTHTRKLVSALSAASRTACVNPCSNSLFATHVNCQCAIVSPSLWISPHRHGSNGRDMARALERVE